MFKLINQNNITGVLPVTRHKNIDFIMTNTFIHFKRINFRFTKEYK